jgi:hypothetical protein
MVWVDPKIAAKVAHFPEVKAAVRVERDKVAGIARGLFASHDNPGGHEITTQDDHLDALVSLEGPAPLSVEFGHWASRDERGRFVKISEGRPREFVEGLHILGRAVAQETA